MNKVFIIGNLGRDVETRSVNGDTVASFPVGCSEKFRDGSGELKSHTEWFNIDAWGKLAENCARYLRKGSKVSVAGSLRTRSYEKNGEMKYITTLRAGEVEFLDPPRSNGNPPPSRPSGGSQEDIPF